MPTVTPYYKLWGLAILSHVCTPKTLKNASGGIRFTPYESLLPAALPLAGWQISERCSEKFNRVGTREPLVNPFGVLRSATIGKPMTAYSPALLQSKKPPIRNRIRSF